jgi:MFS family permease
VLLAVIVALSQLLDDPLVGYVPPGSYSAAEEIQEGPVPWAGLGSRAMLRTSTFGALWVSLGLLSLAAAFSAFLQIVDLGAAAPLLGSFVLAGSIGGCLGGVVAGSLTDRVRRRGMWRAYLAIALSLLVGGVAAGVGWFGGAAFLTAAGGVGVVVVAWVTTIECFGTRYAGTNFGLAFTGWAVGLLLGALAAAVCGEALFKASPASSATFAVAVAYAALLCSGVLVSARLRPPIAHTSVRELWRQKRRDARS